MHKTGIFNRIVNRSKLLFMHGFFTLLPLAITIGIIRFAFRLIKSTLAPVYQLEPSSLKQIPNSEIFVAIIVIFVLGILCDLFLLDVIRHVEQSILNRIPFLRQIYFGAKQLVNALNPKKDHNSATVVIIEYPRPGLYSIGFVTNVMPAQFFADTAHNPGSSGHSGPANASNPDFPLFNPAEKHYSVFVPSVPNPATGHYLVVPARDCKPSGLSRHEALTLIASGGIIQPDMGQE